MNDALKDFIQKNREGFKEKPSDDLWKKIGGALEHENKFNKYKNISAMLKYGFGASLIIVGTFVVINFKKDNAEPPKTNNKMSRGVMIEVPDPHETFTTAVSVTPSKKIEMKQAIKKPLDVVIKEPADTIRVVNTPVEETAILHGNYRPKKDSLDINNWPSAGSQHKKYRLSGDNTTGKTIGCIKSVSNKIDGFFTMMQSSVPDKYLGKRIRVTGYVRTVDVEEWAGLWLRIGAKGGDEALAFDNMRLGKKDRSIKGTTERTQYEVVLDVPPNSANIIYGVILVGTGQIYFDSFMLEVVDDSVPTTGGDPDKLGLYKIDKTKSYNPRNFWRWYVTGHTIAKDGTWNIDLEPNNF